MTTRNRDSGLPPTYHSSFRNSVATSTHQRPPRYSIIYGDPQEVVPAGTHPTKHEFTLRSGVLMRGKPWLTLRVCTRPSMLAHKHPRIFGGENVEGEVEIELDQPMNITSITLYLRGRMRSASVDQAYLFLDVEHTVWTKDAGDPLHPGEKFDCKFCGNFVFPFSFPFPMEADIKPSTKHTVGPVKMSTPQTFMESQINANIDYELVVQVTHGVLRPDSKLKATIVYIPEIMPPPPSEMRQAAYVKGAQSLPWPEKDPQGWLRLPTVATHGIIEQREVTLEYRLCLAQPLSYTRGAVIPCYLAVSSRDLGALAVLAQPEVQRVALRRSITFFEDPTRGVEQVLLQRKEPRTFQDTFKVGIGVWWTPQRPRDENSKAEMDEHTKWLEGEIHLETDLPPSSDFLPFKIEYFVQILRPGAASFQPSTWGEQPQADAVQKELLSHPVTIATLNADGPIPVPFTPKPRRQSLPTARRMGEDSQTIPRYGETNVQSDIVPLIVNAILQVYTRTSRPMAARGEATCTNIILDMRWYPDDPVTPEA